MWVSNKGYCLIAIRVDGKRKLVLEHRNIMEQAIGRKLDTKEIVHHINGNKLDNRLENLEIITWGGHSRLHNHLNPPHGNHNKPWNKGLKAYLEFACSVCGTKTMREARYVRITLKRGRQLVCSNKCKGYLGSSTWFRQAP